MVPLGWVGLAAPLLLTAVPSAAGFELEAASTASGEQWTAGAQWAAVRRPLGLYALDEAFKNGTRPPIPPFVHGVYLRVNWDKVQPAPQVFNWSLIDPTIARARAAGRVVQLGVAPGTSSPRWLYASGAVPYHMPWDLNWSKIPKCSAVPLPVPWDTVYLRAWSAFVSALGARYDNNPTVVAVKVCGVNAPTMEVFLPARPVAACPKAAIPSVQWASLGYTPSKVVQAWDTALGAYDAAFKSTALAMMTGPFPFPGVDEQGRVLSNGKLDWNLTQTLLDRFVARFDPHRVTLQSNGMCAYWWWTPPSDLPPGSRLGAQALAAISNDPTCRMVHPHSTTPGCNPVTVMNKTLQNVVRHNVSYYEVYIGDIVNPAMWPLLSSWAARFPPSR